MLTCKGCGQQFKKHRSKLYCSETCKSRSKHKPAIPVSTPETDASTPDTVGYWQVDIDLLEASYDPSGDVIESVRILNGIVKGRLL